MALPELEGRLKQLEGRLSKVESHLKIDSIQRPSLWVRLFKAPVGHADGPTSAEFWNILGWFVIVVSLFAIWVSWSINLEISPLLSIWLLAGSWIVFAKSDALGTSETTLQLLHEGRVQRNISAHNLHPHPHQNSGKSFATKQPLLSLLYLLLAILIALSLSLFFFTYINNAAWQLFAFLVVFVAALGSAIRFNSRVLIFITSLATYLVLATAYSAPLLAVLCIGLLSLSLAYLAWKKSDWTMLLMVVVASYLSITNWFLIDSAATASLFTQIGLSQAILAELLLILMLVFVSPFILKRRDPENRGVVKAIIILNSLGYTLLSAWVVSVLLPDQTLLGLLSIVLFLGAAMLIAYKRHGRYSHAKYFGFAALIALLLGSMIYLTAQVSTFIWFMGSILVLTVGFVIESYTARMVGLATLIGAYGLYYMNLLPVSDNSNFWLQSRVWVGFLLAGFIAIVAYWYNELKAKGAERELQNKIVWCLLTLAGLILLSIYWISIQGTL